MEMEYEFHSPSDFLLFYLALRPTSGRMQPCVSRFRLKAECPYPPHKVLCQHTRMYISLQSYIMLMAFCENFKFIASMKRQNLVHQIYICAIWIVDYFKRSPLLKMSEMLPTYGNGCQGKSIAAAGKRVAGGQFERTLLWLLPSLLRATYRSDRVPCCTYITVYVYVYVNRKRF